MSERFAEDAFSILRPPLEPGGAFVVRCGNCGEAIEVPELPLPKIPAEPPSEAVHFAGGPVDVECRNCLTMYRWRLWAERT